MPKGQPTIADIAARVGVAAMTVSRAINGSGYVSAKTRVRIMKAVRESNYRPNGIARSLRNRKTHVVGVLLPDVGNPFAAELAGIVEETLLGRGYSCFIATTQRSVKREQSALAAFYDHRVDGLLVATRETHAGNQTLATFAERNLPMVLVGRRFTSGKVDHVTADHWSGGVDVTAHLIAGGHRHIAFIGASLMNGSGLARFQGYLAAMRENGLEVPTDYLAAPEESDSPAYSTHADGYEALKRLMALPQPPTAIFARNDYTAMGAICAAHDLGMKVPGDIAIAGFDNIALSAYTAPPLTTVEQCMTEQGRQAALFLLDRLEGLYSGGRREVSLGCRLIVRQSTVAQGGAGA
jgi:DNA-binding LacI/PurR family transcriptional regulator